MTNLSIQEDNDGVILTVKVLPGSSRTVIRGVLEGMLKVAVSAAPEKGKANRCLVQFLAKKIGVKKNAVHIVSGSTNPVKQVQISDVSFETILSKLSLDDEDFD